MITESSVIAHDIITDCGVGSSAVGYGGDRVCSMKLRVATADFYNIEAKDYAFKVCRIVPDNNIFMILAASSKTNY